MRAEFLPADLHAILYGYLARGYWRRAGADELPVVDAWRGAYAQALADFDAAWAERHSYHRRAGERARIVMRTSAVPYHEDLDDDNWDAPSDAEIAPLLHGDLLWRGGYRAEGVYAVVEDFDGNKTAVHIAAEYSHGEIPPVVSAGLEDPEGFYSSTHTEHPAIDDWTNVDISRIAMYPPAHSRRLCREAGGRRIHHARRVVFQRTKIDNDGIFHGVYMITGDPSFDITPTSHDAHGVLQVRLSADTPDEYLAAPVLRRGSDPCIARARAANRHAHEVAAYAYFRTLAPGHRIDLCDVPPPPQPPSLAVTRVWSASRPAVTYPRFDGPDRCFHAVHPDPSNPENIMGIWVDLRGMLVYYHPLQVTANRGVYGHVRLWTEQGASNRVIDLRCLGAITQEDLEAFGDCR